MKRAKRRYFGPSKEEIARAVTEAVGEWCAKRPLPPEVEWTYHYYTFGPRMVHDEPLPPKTD